LRLHSFQKLKFLIFLFSLFSAEVLSASFNCEKATTGIEKFICADVDISYMDESLSNVYNLLLDYSHTETSDTLRREQRLWLVERNKNCYSRFNCLTIYTKRLNELKIALMHAKLRGALFELSGQSTNTLMWRDYFQDFIKLFSGGHKFKLLSNDWLLSHDISAVLGGPPNDITRHKGYFVGSACRHHSCFEKSIFAVRYSDMSAVFGVTHGVTLSLFYKNKEFFKSVEKIIIKRAQKEASSEIKIIVPVQL